MRVLSSAGIVILFSMLLIRFRSTLSPQVASLLYLVPITVSATLWGVSAGVTASLLSFLLYNYFFIHPYNTLHVAEPQDILSMFVLLGVAILISSLMARTQFNLKKAQAREREALQLSQLSVDLTNQHSAADIANVVASHIVKFFQNSIVVVTLEQSQGALRIQVPEGAKIMEGATKRNLSLVSSRGLLGKIEIWLPHETIAPEEERLLQTFTNQAVLAFDRADLVDAQTRARVVEESDRLKTAILSSVSHELRTPLASIQAAATSIFNPDVRFAPEAQAELQSLLLEEINRMSQVVGNLLNMSRIDAGALNLQRQWNSLAEIVDHSVQSLRTTSGGHPIVVDVSEDLPLVAVDSILLEQVIINLVRNSLRFSPPNTPVRISAKAVDPYLRVTVSNEGPSIPEEHLGHIFEKFYPMPGRDASLSVGLGLSICEGVVEAHGGQIWAENLPNGVAFTFTLPLDWEGSHPVVPEEETEEE